MTTTTTPESPVPETTEEIAKHSSVGKLVEQIDKAIKRNPAMPVGELWRWHLKALITELHQFHLDYTDDAVDEVGGDGGGEYAEALAGLAQEGRDLVFALTTLLMGAYGRAGYLDEKGAPVVERMPEDSRAMFTSTQERVQAWVSRFSELVDDGEDDKPEGGAQ